MEKHLQTFSHRERKKVCYIPFKSSCLFLFSIEPSFVYLLLISLFCILQMPDMLNWFGWCSWDAFYTDVTSEGVKQGLERYYFVHHKWRSMLKKACKGLSLYLHFFF